MQQQETLEDARKAEIARKILAECKPATNSIAQTYLASRGINIVPKQLLFQS